MRITLLAPIIAIALVVPVSAAQTSAPPATPQAGTDGAIATPATPKTTQELIDSAQPSDWRTPDPDSTLYVELDSGRVIVELAPRFAPAHVANIRTLARGGYWNGLSINRSQDNFVVQWGDPAGDGEPRKPLGEAKAQLPAEFERDSHGLAFHALPDKDGWAAQTGFADGFPAARDASEKKSWLAHCYGTVGAGRDVAADSSNGTELYVVDGQSPRQLDRNITVVGRVVQGMELLSTLPRGTGPLGFYEKPEQRIAIKSITLASDVPEPGRTPLQLLRTDTALFDAIVESRRNRRDDWYKRPAGHIDLCNISVPVRVVSRDKGR